MKRSSEYIVIFLLVVNGLRCNIYGWLLPSGIFDKDQKMVKAGVHKCFAPKKKKGQTNALNF